MKDILYSIGITVCNGKVEARVTGFFVEVVRELELRPQLRCPFAGRKRGTEAGKEMVELVEDQDSGLDTCLLIYRTEAEFAIRMVAHHLDIESDQVNVWIVGTNGVEGGITITHRIVDINLGQDGMAALVSQEKINSLFSLYKLRNKLSKCQLTSSKSEGQR